MRKYFTEHPGTKPLPVGSRAKNYAGMGIDRLYVEGHYGLSKKCYTASGKRRPIRERIMWVVRCSCGRYETRSTKHLAAGISNPKHRMMCRKCFAQYKEEMGIK